MEYRSYKMLRDFSKFLRFTESLEDEETKNRILYTLERGVAKLNFVCDVKTPSDTKDIN